MKRFFFVIEPKRRDRVGTNMDEVRLYHWTHNAMHHLGTEPQGYRTPEQAALQIAIKQGTLSYKHAGTPAYSLDAAGVARFEKL